MNDPSSFMPSNIVVYRDALIGALPAPEALEVGIFDAVNLVIADPVYAAQPVPQHALASADGLAVKAHDTAYASLATPVRFSIAGNLPVGSVDGTKVAIPVREGEALPYGWDAVLPVSPMTAARSEVVLTSEVSAGDRVLTAGSEIATRQLLATSGHVVTPADVALFSAAGLDRVACVPAPRIVVFGISADDPLSHENPTEKTRPAAMMVAALVREMGAMVFLGDGSFASREALAQALDANLGRADLMILVGGNAPTTAPRVAAVLASLGASAPTQVNLAGCESQLFGAIGSCPVVAVSDRLGAAHREFELFLRPAIRHLQGLNDAARTTISAVLAADISAETHHDQYVAVRVFRVGEVWHCEPFSNPGFASPTTVALTDGYVQVSAGGENLICGAHVDVILTAS